MLTLPNKVYDAVKYLVLIFLPAFASAYNALGQGLDLPAVAKVTLVCAVLATFLGTLVGISAKSYNNDNANFDGVLEINKHDPSVLHSLDLDNTDPSDLARAKTVRLRVRKVDAELPPPDVA